MGRQYLELRMEELKMRNITFLFAAIAALTVSCQKEPVAENVPVKGVEKAFFVTSPDTRTAIDGLSIQWSEGDEISVVAAGTGNQYTFTLSDGAGSSSATFTGTLAEEDAEETTFYAVYPAVDFTATSTAISITNNLNNKNSTQTAVRDGFDPNFAVMYAVSSDGKFSFQHGVAYFKIKMAQEGISKVTLYTHQESDYTNTKGTRFYGRPVYDISDIKTYATSINGAANNISLAPADGTLEVGATYYIPVLVKNTKLYNLTIHYTFEDGRTGYMTTGKKANVNLEMGHVYDLGSPVINMDPVISVTAPGKLEYDATSGSFAYSVMNPVDGEEVTATLEADVDWISNIVVGDESVTFDCTVHEGTEERSAVITLSYPGAEDVEVTVTQKVSGGAAESHEYVFYVNGSKAEVNLADGETGTYFSMGASSMADLGGDYAISEWTLGGYSSTKALKMNSSGTLSFTTSATLSSTVRFYFIRRKSTDTAAQIQLVPASGEAVVIDTPYDTVGDSGVIELEKDMAYTIKQKKSEQALLLVVVNEKE